MNCYDRAQQQMTALCNEVERRHAGGHEVDQALIQRMRGVLLQMEMHLHGDDLRRLLREERNPERQAVMDRIHRIVDDMEACLHSSASFRPAFSKYTPAHAAD